MNNRQQTIPPARTRVKAGFVVYTPGTDDSSEDRSIVILNEGELVAREKGNPDSEIFTMRPGDLVGVAALLEREPFRFEIVATKDSDITLVNEECMESELKQLPLWLLAVVKNLSGETRRLKQAACATRVENTVKSLALFLSKKESHRHNEPILHSLAQLLQEYSWMTKVDIETAQLDIRSLFRRHLVELVQKDGRILLRIVDCELLKIFVDFEDAKDAGSDFGPYKLSLYQKKVLALLSAIPESEAKDSPSWLAFIKQNDASADVAEWIFLKKLGWFKSSQGKGSEGELYSVDLEQVKYYLKALRYETNIRGIL